MSRVDSQLDPDPGQPEKTEGFESGHPSRQGAVSSRSMKRLLLEMVVIVLSVLLALVVNEWRQGVARSATVASVLNIVRSEIEANQAQLEPALQHHRDLRRQLESGGIVRARIDLTRTRLDTTSAAGFARTVSAFIREEIAVTDSSAPTNFSAERLPDGRWRIFSPQAGPGWVTIEGDTAIVRSAGFVLQDPVLLGSAWEAVQATQSAVHIDAAIVAALAQAREFQREAESVAGDIMSMMYSGALLQAIEAGNTGAFADLVYYETKLLETYKRLLRLLPPAGDADASPTAADAAQ